MVVRNEEKRIKECLLYHMKYVDEVAICDQSSTDKTQEIILEVKKQSKIPFHFIIDEARGFCEPSKQKTAELLTSDWILYVDPDERFHQEFLANMMRIFIEKYNYDGYAFPRNSIFDIQIYDDSVPIEPKWIKIQHPARDYQFRLTRRKLSVFPAFLHTRVRVSGQTKGERIGKLIYPIEHRKTITEQYEDMKRYRQLKK